MSEVPILVMEDLAEIGIKRLRKNLILYGT
jgi:hypothetical protein